MNLGKGLMKILCTILATSSNNVKIKSFKKEKKQIVIKVLLLLLLSHFSRVQLCATPERRQPTRLPRPWDSPGKNTGVGCHFLLQGMKVKVKSLSRV